MTALSDPLLVNAERDLGVTRGLPRPTHTENEAHSLPSPIFCEACGVHHGSVNAELACLRRALREARGTP